MTNRAQLIAPAACVVLALVCAVQAARVYSGPGSLLLIGQGALGALVLAVVLLVARALRGGTVTAHVHGAGSLREAAGHEGGHAAVGVYVGGRVGRAWVDESGAGEVKIHLGRHDTPVNRAAVALGGALAEGVSIRSRQCRGDLANLDRAIARLSYVEQAAARTEAAQLAAAGLAQHRAVAADLERRLIRDGRA